MGRNWLGKMLNALCCLLPDATQQVCKFSSASHWRAVEICLRAIGSGNQLGNCFIWDISTEENSALSQSVNVEN